MKLSRIVLAIFLLVIMVGSMGCDNGKNKVEVNVDCDGNCDCPGDDCDTDIGVTPCDNDPNCVPPDYGQISWQATLPDTGGTFDIKVFFKGRGDWINFEYSRNFEDFSNPVAYGTENDVPVGVYDASIKWRPTGFGAWAEIVRVIEVTHNNPTNVPVNIGDVIIVALAESSPSGFRSPAADDRVLVLKSWGPTGSRLTRLDYQLMMERRNGMLTLVNLEGTLVWLYQGGKALVCDNIDATSRVEFDNLDVDPNAGDLSLHLNSASLPLEAGVNESLTIALTKAKGINSFREIIAVYGPLLPGNPIIYYK